ncbi:hypothetical protein THII_3334 [Thioploca ingrica]|uniref:Uncharacterized protein n=1 Tax=Thioploca ingrica TaxID=40754 RepID=A0A090BVX8_9GAMM|nr:hypothetical protein THII_3334 [Thioploca ingrica]
MLMRSISLLALTYLSVSPLSLAHAALNFDDFSNISSLQLNGSTTTAATADGMVLRLTPAIQEKQVGSVFTQLPINASQFSTFFTFRLTESGGTNGNLGNEEKTYDGSTGGQGLVFVIQSYKSDWLDLKDHWNNDWQQYEPSGLGYNYLPYSLGVEFDTWGDVWNADPNSNHMAIIGERTTTHTDIPNFAVTAITPNFNDGNLWYTWVDYNGTTLEVRTSQTCQRPSAPTLSQAVDLPAILGGKNVGEQWIERINEAFIGFTATTSPEGFNNQDIINWSYRDTFAPINSPQLEIWDGTTQITRGATVDIGSTPANTPVSKTFTVKNTGDLTLRLNSPALSADFSLVGDLPKVIPAGGTAEITVQFKAPANPGTVTGTFQLAYNGCNENSFNFGMTAQTTALLEIPGGSIFPISTKIQILDGETEIVDDTNTPIDFGITGVGKPITKTFTVKNVGESTLALVKEVAMNSETGGFDVTSFPAPTFLRAGESTTFQITLNATNPGLFAGMVSLGTDEHGGNPFTFSVSGMVYAKSPLIEQQKICFEQQNGLLNQEQCIPVDAATTITSTGIPTDAKIKAGISKYVNGMPVDFQRSDAVTVADSIMTAGVIKVDSQDIGKQASIIATGIYISSSYLRGFMWYLLSDCPNCPQGWMVTELPYNETTALPLLTQPALLPLKTVDSLPEYYTVNLYAGNLPMPGFLNIFWGYRIEAGDDKGKVVFNMTPISIMIYP